MSRAATPQTRDLPACLRRFGIGHSDEACGAGGPRGPAMDALSRMPLKELMSLHIARSVDPGGDQAHSALAEGPSPRRRRSVAVGRGRALTSRDGPRSFPSYGDGGGEWYTQSLKPAAALRQQEEFAHISDDEVRGALALRLRRSRGEALAFGVGLLRELAGRDEVFPKGIELIRSLSSSGLVLPVRESFQYLAARCAGQRDWRGVAKVSAAMEQAMEREGHRHALEVAGKARVFELALHANKELGDLKAMEATFRHLQRLDRLSVSHFEPMIAAYGRAGLLNEASGMKHIMRASGFRPTVRTYNALIHAYKKKGMMNKVLKLVDEMYREEVRPDDYTYNVLIQIYASRKPIDVAIRFLREVRATGKARISTLSYNHLLGACKKKLLVPEARILYNDMKLHGVKPDAVTYSSLMAMFRRCRRRDELVSLLGDIRKHEREGGLELDRVLSDDLIWAYAETGNHQRASATFDGMRRRGLQRTDFSYAGMTAAYGVAGRLQEARSVLDEARTSGVRIPCGLFKLVIDVGAAAGQHDFVREMVDEAMRADDVTDEIASAAHNALIKACAKSGKHEEAERVLRTLLLEGHIEPTLFMFTSLISAYSKRGSLGDCMRLFDEMVTRDLRPDITTFNALLYAVANRPRQRGSPDEAEADPMKRILDSMNAHGVSPDSTTYSIMTRFLGAQNEPSGLLELYETAMRSAGTEHPATGLADLVKSFIHAFCACGEFEMAQKVFRQAMADGVAVGADGCNVILQSLRRYGRVQEMAELVDELKRRAPYMMNVITYTTMIEALAGVGMVADADRMWRDMIGSGIEPDLIAFNAYFSVLVLQKEEEEVSASGKGVPSAGAGGAAADEGVEAALDRVFGDMHAFGLQPDGKSYNTLINAFLRVGNLERARGTLDKMQDAGFPLDQATYTHLISHYLKKGRVLDAMELVDESETHALALDEVALNTQVSMFAQAGRVQQARALMRRLERDARAPCSVVTYNHLISGLCHGGRMLDARGVIVEMLEAGVQPDLVTFNTLINGYCRLAQFEEAWDLVREMSGAAFRAAPDVVTYNTFLSAYAKLLLPGVVVNEAEAAADVGAGVREVLARLSDSGLAADVRTYASLASIYAAGGEVDKLPPMLEEMRAQSIAPTAAVYNAILFARARTADAGAASLDTEKCIEIVSKGMEMDGVARTAETIALLSSLRSGGGGSGGLPFPESDEMEMPLLP